MLWASSRTCLAPTPQPSTSPWQGLSQAQAQAQGIKPCPCSTPSTRRPPPLPTRQSSSPKVYILGGDSNTSLLQVPCLLQGFCTVQGTDPDSVSFGLELADVVSLLKPAGFHLVGRLYSPIAVKLEANALPLGDVFLDDTSFFDTRVNKGSLWLDPASPSRPGRTWETWAGKSWNKQTCTLR